MWGGMGRNNCIIGVLCLVALLVGCRSVKYVIPDQQPTILNDTTSVSHEKIIEYRIDSVMVYVDVPREVVKVVVNDSTNHLETTLAESDAWINPDGTLGHTLSNKPQKIESKTAVIGKNTQDVKVEERIKEVAVNVPTPYPVEKELTIWQKIRLGAFYWLIGLLVILIAITIRVTKKG